METETRRGEAGATASDHRGWLRWRRHYHDDVVRYLRFVIPPGSRVLDLGCGSGETLARLEPSRGLGIDVSPEMVRLARERHPGEGAAHLEFRVADAQSFELDETFDYVVLSGVLGELADLWAAFRALRRVCHEGTRVVVVYYNALWEPALRLAERLGLKRPQPEQNWLSMADVSNLLGLNGFEVITSGARLLLPLDIPLVAPC
jgi:ubiquinone/menaquinone biosynthesis C-methylase UbiE